MLTTDDKFHPVNTIQRALDYGDPLDRDEVRELLNIFSELEGNASLEVQELEERIEELENDRDSLEDRLSQAVETINNLLKQQVGLGHA